MRLFSSVHRSKLLNDPFFPSGTAKPANVCSAGTSSGARTPSPINLRKNRNADVHDEKTTKNGPIQISAPNITLNRSSAGRGIRGKIDAFRKRMAAFLAKI